MACLLLTGQLPPTVHSRMKEWIAERDEINKAVARDFIVLVRKSLAEKGIPLDIGYRDLNRDMTMSIEYCLDCGSEAYEEAGLIPRDRQGCGIKLSRSSDKSSLNGNMK